MFAGYISLQQPTTNMLVREWQYEQCFFFVSIKQIIQIYEVS
jgi:hypothetical protein